MVTVVQGYGTVDLNSSATFSATCTNLTGGACTGVPSGYLPIGFTFTNDPLSTESVIINIPSLAGKRKWLL